MAGWIMPVVIGGLMMYAKSKASAAFRWILSDEASVKSMPVALLLTKVTTGEALPAAPQGFRWKQIEVSFASSPFAAPQTLVINVLEQWLNGASKPEGVSGFLTSQAVVQARGMGFFPGQILPDGFVAGFLDKETFAMSPAMGEVLDRSQYLYSPQTAPDFGDVLQKLPNAGGDSALGQLGLELRSKGLVLAPVGPNGLRHGDYVVTHEGWLHRVVGRGLLREIHPRAGRASALGRRYRQGFGVRRV